MKLQPNALALSSAVTFAVIWVLCSLLVALLPGMMMDMTGDMIHADMNQMSWSMNFGGFVVGLVIWSLLASATGWLIAIFYNRFCNET